MFYVHACRTSVLMKYWLSIRKGFTVFFTYISVALNSLNGTHYVGDKNMEKNYAFWSECYFPPSIAKTWGTILRNQKYCSLNFIKFDLNAVLWDSVLFFFVFMVTLFSFMWHQHADSDLPMTRTATIAVTIFKREQHHCLRRQLALF